MMKQFRKIKALVACAAVGLAVLGAKSANADLLLGATGSGGSTGILGTIDITNGAFTAIGNINDSLGNNYSVTGVAFNPLDGLLYGSVNNNSVTSRRSLIH